MQAQTLTAIARSISAPRLSSYRILTGSSQPETNIGAYIWNKRVSAALYPMVQCLEVTLRNAVHSAATKHFFTPDWFDPVIKLVGDDYFLAEMKKNPHINIKFYRSGICQGKRAGRQKWISHHENMVAKAREKLLKQGKKSIADAVLAEMMFGFWVGLFEKKYNDITSTARLWPHLEIAVFPHLTPAARKASTVHLKLLEIKDLRNRMAHHEPIWKHKLVTSATSACVMLNGQIDNIVMLIKGMSTERADMLFNSGIEGMARGICHPATLNYYISGQIARKIPLRKLQRDAIRYLKGKKQLPATVISQDRETVFMDLWLLNSNSGL